MRRGDPWAVQMGLKTQFGWKPDGAGGFIMPPDLEGERPAIRIQFVVPSGKHLQEFDDVMQPLAPPTKTIEAKVNQPTSVPIVPPKRNGGHWMD